MSTEIVSFSSFWSEAVANSNVFSSFARKFVCLFVFQENSSNCLRKHDMQVPIESLHFAPYMPCYLELGSFSSLVVLAYSISSKLFFYR